MLTGVTAVSDGGEDGEHSLALLSNGTVVAWGANANGELGNATTEDSDVPVTVSLSLPPGVTVKAISAGGSDSLALLSNGEVRAWGNNFLGELGNGTVTSSDVPVAVCALGATPPCSAGNGNVLTGVTAVSAARNTSMALLRTYPGRSCVAGVESFDRPAFVPFDQEVFDGSGQP